MAGYLGIGLQVVIEDIDTDGEVTSVVRIRAVPALWSKLPPLHNNSMEIDQREEDALKLILAGTYLQGVLLQCGEGITS